MGTRCLVTVIDGNKEILCLYRQWDGYPKGMGADLLKAFRGWTITKGISGEPKNTANGIGCFAAQVVTVLKRRKPGKAVAGYDGGNGCEVGSVYMFAPESRELGEEYIYTFTARGPEGRQRLWLDLWEGQVAYFGMPGTPPDGMDRLYSGWLDDFAPGNIGQVHHGKVAG